MLRRPVKSSGMRSVGYDPLAEILEIEFMSGNVFQYLDVPVKIYEGLLSAESKEKYFHRHINQIFEHRPVE